MQHHQRPDTAKALRVAMAKTKTKQKDLAAAVGLTVQQISRLSVGTQTIQGETLNKIAAALGMKSSEFLALGED